MAAKIAGRVFFSRPDRGVPRRSMVPVIEEDLAVGDGGGALAPCGRLPARGPSPEVVLGGSRERGVSVGAPDHPEGEGVRPGLRRLAESELERRARVLERELALVLGRGFVDVEVAEIPGLEVGKFVVRREERMRLAVALHLGHLDDRLVPRASLAVGAIEGPPLGVLDGEHAAVAQIGIVRNREDAAPGLRLVALHEGPEIFGAIAVVGRHRRESCGFLGIVTVHDHAMEVVAPRP